MSQSINPKVKNKEVLEFLLSSPEREDLLSFIVKELVGSLNHKVTGKSLLYVDTEDQSLVHFCTMTEDFDLAGRYWDALSLIQTDIKKHQKHIPLYTPFDTTTCKADPLFSSLADLHMPYHLLALPHQGCGMLLLVLFYQTPSLAVHVPESDLHFRFLVERLVGIFHKERAKSVGVDLRAVPKRKTSTLGILVINRQGIIQNFNPIAKKLLGLEESPLGLSVLRFTPVRLRDKLIAIFLNKNRSQNHFEEVEYYSPLIINQQQTTTNLRWCLNCSFQGNQELILIEIENPGNIENPQSFLNGNFKLMRKLLENIPGSIGVINFRENFLEFPDDGILKKMGYLQIASDIDMIEFVSKVIHPKDAAWWSNLIRQFNINQPNEKIVEFREEKGNYLQVLLKFVPFQLEDEPFGENALVLAMDVSHYFDSEKSSETTLDTPEILPLSSGYGSWQWSRAEGLRVCSTLASQLKMPIDDRYDFHELDHWQRFFSKKSLISLQQLIDRVVARKGRRFRLHLPAILADGSQVLLDIRGEIDQFSDQSYYYRGIALQESLVNEVLTATPPVLQSDLFSIQDFPLPICETDEFLNITDKNTSFDRWFDVSIDSALTDVVEVGSKSLKSYFADAIKNHEEFFSLQLSFSMRGDRLSKIDLSALLQFDANQKFLRAVITFAHAHEAMMEKFETREQELKELKASQEDYFSKIAHELRNPINGIMGLSEQLLRSKMPEDDKAGIRHIYFSAQMVYNLSNDLLDLSKAKSGMVKLEYRDFDFFQLIQILERTIKNQKHNYNNELSFHIAENIPQYINSDALRLNQILLNLLSNAHKFTLGGKVSLEVEMAGTEESPKLKFIVRDSGIGIPKSQISKIFDPYRQATRDVTRRFGGTGLGLSITKSLVSVFNGEISVESIEGVGTTFEVILPYRPCKAHRIESPQASSSWSSLKGLKVLYVEDSVVNQFLMKKICDQEGIILRTTASGLNAMEIIKFDTNYNIVLMDLSLSDITGFEATQGIRSLGTKYHANIPIVALTASTKDDLGQKVIKAGMNDILLKPFSKEQVYLVFAEYALPFKGLKKSMHLEPVQHLQKKVIDFERMKTVFTQEDEFSGFIGVVIREFEDAKEDLIDSLSTQDAVIFHKVMHKLKSSLDVFQMEELKAYRDSIQEVLSKGEQLSVVQKSNFESAYSNVLEELNNTMGALFTK
ncbi:hybrid sensor histidine kinase/response regulator [Persicobacter psychrovividus]|uniref:histidine kinase n=1 Tax=Persicobacter psychrovividus TaxID=387638 RepID=A0ABN6LB53_9BACT|nr:hypothetical protein PEPS_11680 [Persicobacter psychrovividus]